MQLRCCKGLAEKKLDLSGISFPKKPWQKHKCFITTKKTGKSNCTNRPCWHFWLLSQGSMIKIYLKCMASFPTSANAEYVASRTTSNRHPLSSWLDQAWSSSHEPFLFWYIFVPTELMRMSGHGNTPDFSANKLRKEGRFLQPQTMLETLEKLLVMLW